MATIEMIDIDCCTDCLLMMANGECDPEREQEVCDGQARLWNGYTLVAASMTDHGTAGHSNDDDCPCSESWFSWSPCEGCGSTLGGDRRHAVAMAR